MSAFDYTRSRATADRMITRYGQTGTLRRTTTTGGYNPTTSTTDYAATFVVLDYSTREVDGSRILATDKKVLLAKASLAIEPAPTTDKLLIGGVAHSIISPVKPLSPGGTVVLWELQCRR